MTSNTILFEHPDTGEIQTAPVGFSWTTLFFGPFPLLYRGSWRGFLLSLLLALLTCGLSSLVLMFVVNRLYVRSLIRRGFRARMVDAGTLEQVSRSLGFALPVYEDAG